MVRVLLLACGVACGLGACIFDWDKHDPRLSPVEMTGGAGGVAGNGGDADVGSGGGGGEPLGPWYDEGLSERIALTMQLPADSEVLADFPVLVTVASSDGSDIRFVADDHETLLSFDIDTVQADETLVWVRVPQLGPEPLTVWLYKSGTPRDAAPDPTTTWSNDFVAVWHLGASARDATGPHQAAGTATATSGFVGEAHTFDADADYLDVTLTSALDDFFVGGGTVSVWIAPESAGENDRGRILDRSSTPTFDEGWSVLMSTYSTPGSVGLGYGYATDQSWWTTPVDSITYGAWQHFAIAFDIDTMPSPAMYLDAVSQNVGMSGAPMGAPDAVAGVPVRIGGRVGAGDRDYDGAIDELRLSTGIRSEDWIAAEVLSARRALVAYGNVETQ